MACWLDGTLRMRRRRGCCNRRGLGGSEIQTLTLAVGRRRTRARCAGRSRRATSSPISTVRSAPWSHRTWLARSGFRPPNSLDFIAAVRPRWAIFSARHQYGHPRAIAAERYIASGMQPECLLQTDRWDDERPEAEWDFGRVNNSTDPVGDEHIENTLPASGDPVVQYVGGSPPVCAAISPATPPANVGPVVKKSGSGICHSQSSPWYHRTRNFEPFDSVEACIQSGGRLPR